MAKKKATRASNGMGSVRQRPDGRWEARFSLPDGRQRSVYAKTEKDVTQKLRAALHELDTAGWREPSKLTVSEWMDIWLRDYQAHTISRTVKTYSDIVRLHITPVIGTIKMPKLTQIHVRRVISTMQEKGLSPTYIRQAHGVLSVSFNAAVDAGILKANPAKGVKTPRIVNKKFTIVDRNKIPDFISAAKDDVNGNAMIFLLMTGLRAAEERGLKWGDIDLDAGTMEIERQLPCKGAPAFTAPKDGSTRTIELPPEAVELLRQQKKAQAEQRLAAGDKWVSNPIVDGLVFRSARGWFLSESVLHKAVRALGVKIGLPELHPHDLRHSYAVAALRSGIDVKTVQNNLGHKNAAMTLDTYAGYTSDAGKMGAKKFSEYWQNALKKS